MNWDLLGFSIMIPCLIIEIIICVRLWHRMNRYEQECERSYNIEYGDQNK